MAEKEYIERYLNLDTIKRKNAEILELQGDLKLVRGTNKRLLDLCDEKDAEIKRLLETIDKQQEEIDNFADIGKMYSEIRTEATKEFAERMKKNAKKYTEYDEGGWDCTVYAVKVEDIDNTVEEMTEEK